MANTPIVIFRGAATTTLTTTLNTVPSLKSWIITDIWVTNDAATDATANITLDGISILPGTTIPQKGGLNLTPKQVLAAGKTVKGGASATTVNFHISGVEVS